MNLTHPHLRGREQGVISVLFILLSGLLVGMVGYSLYIGQAVKQKIDLQNAADASTLAMAQHASQGLNMIAANNLTIGASIHINTSVEIVASYLSMARALVASVDDLKEILPVINDAIGNPISSMQDTIQNDVWNRLAPISSYLFRMASGTTELNKFTAEYWLYPTPIRGAESLRLNKPDAIFLPFQKSKLDASKISIPLMEFSGLRQTMPHDTVCQALRASRNIPAKSRDNVLNWLLGPVQSMKLMTSDTFQSFQQALDRLQGIMVISIGHVDCGFGLKTSLFELLQNAGQTMADSTNMATATGVKGVVQAMGMDGVADSYISEAKNAFNCKSWQTGCKIAEGICNEVVGRIVSGLENVNPLTAKDEIKALTIKKGIEDLRMQGDTLECGGKKGQIAVIDASGKELCFDVDQIHPDCPLWEAIHKSQPAQLACPAHRSHMDTQISGNGICATYRAWRNASNPASPNNRQESEQRQLSDAGLKIMNTAKQAKRFGDGKVDSGTETVRMTVRDIVAVKDSNKALYQEARAASDKCRQNIDFAEKKTKSWWNPQKFKALGYVCSITIPGNDFVGSKNLQISFMIPSVGVGGLVFENSIRFGAIAALPMRTRSQIPAGELCDNALKVKDADQVEHCDFTPIISLVTHKGAETAETGKNLDLINMDHGGMTRLVQSNASQAGAFASSWQRSMWVLSEARLRHDPNPLLGDPEPTEPQMRLFYPAWRAHYSTMSATSIAAGLTPMISTAPAVEMISNFKGAAE